MTAELQQLERQLGSNLSDQEQMRIYSELCFGYNRIDPAKGLAFGDRALTIARASNNADGIAEAQRSRAWCYQTLTKHHEAQECAEEALQISRELQASFRMGSCLNLLGVICHATAQHAKAFQYLNEAEVVFQSMNELRGLSSTYNNRGIVHQDLAQYAEALNDYFAALRVNEERHDHLQVVSNLINISNVYYYLGDFDKSFEIDQRSLKLSREIGSDYNVARGLGAISLHYGRQKRFDLALKSLHEAQAITLRLGERRFEGTLLVKMGTVSEHMGDDRAALTYFTRAQRLAESTGVRETIANAMLNRGFIYLRHKQIKRAIELLAKAVRTAHESNLPRLEIQACKGLSEALAQAQRFAEALEQYRRYSELLQESLSSERQKTISEIQARFDVERAEREQEILRLKNAHLEEMMDLRSRELNSLALRVVQKNRFLRKMAKDVHLLREALVSSGVQESQPNLSSTTEATPDVQVVLQELEHEIESQLRSDDEWTQFKEEFQRTHPDFIKNLSQLAPKLTRMELRVCAMMKLNLANKEIAQLLSVSRRNVESHRYSIRKKLNLTKDANLASFIMSL